VAVFHLVPRSGASDNDDSVIVYRHLLQLALQGRIEGSEVTLRLRGGGEKTFFTGLYYENPAEAGNAAMRLCIKIAKAQEEDEDEDDGQSIFRQSEIPRTRY
jgi:hypothetical protein